MAGVQGFEPQLPDSESGVLPLNYTPSPLHHSYEWHRITTPKNIPHLPILVKIRKGSPRACAKSVLMRFGSEAALKTLFSSCLAASPPNKKRKLIPASRTSDFAS